MEYMDVDHEAYLLPTAEIILDLDGNIESITRYGCKSCQCKSCRGGCRSCRAKKLPDKIDELDIESMFLEVNLN